MTISVLMGVYNCETTLVEALDSLYNQTYKDFEIILCDDGSNDNTYQIAQDYSRKVENIVLLKNDNNQGLNYTLNKCLKFAKGLYVARMDGDDISLPERFSLQIEYLNSNPEIDFVSSAMIYFDGSGDFKIGKVKQYPSKKDFVSGTPFCHAPAMIRYKAIVNVGGYTENKRLIRVEDYHLWFKLYSVGYKGYNFSIPLYKMRDDRKALKRRKFKYRLNEFYVRIIGFKMLDLPFYYYIFAFKPILIGLLPVFVYNYLHRS